MKKTTLYLLFIFIFSCNSFEDNKADIINLMINEVTYLSSDELEGRETGTEGELLAAKYISTKFEEYGLIGKGTDGFFQKFEASIKENPHSNTIKRKIEKYLLDNDIKIVIHCAGMARVRECEKFKSRAFKTNVLGTANIAKSIQNIG